MSYRSKHLDQKHEGIFKGPHGSMHAFLVPKELCWHLGTLLLVKSLAWPILADFYFRLLFSFQKQENVQIGTKTLQKYLFLFSYLFFADAEVWPMGSFLGG